MGQSKKWDAAEFLDDDETIAAYLNAVLEDDNQELLIVALRNVARAKGMTQLSEKTGITRDRLYKALSPSRNPSFATLHKVLKALDLKFEVELSA